MSLPLLNVLLRLQLTSLSTHTYVFFLLPVTWGYDRNGVKSEHAVSIYPAVDAIENETDLAIEEEKEWVENKARSQADRRWSEGQPGRNDAPPPGSNKRRRFNSNDGEEGNTPGTNANSSRYKYYNKETIRVPPSEFNRLVLVENVASNVTTSELRQIFGNIGTIEKIYLPVENNQMDGTKRAEILYEKPKHAHTAVKALNHLTLCQQSLKLKLASADSRIDSNFLKASSSTMSKQQETAIDSLLEIH